MLHVYMFDSFEQYQLMSIKNIQSLSLKKISHRVLLLKSSAFIKIALVKEETPSEIYVDGEVRKNVKKFTQIVGNLFSQKDFQAKTDGLQKIQEAGWKLIVEAQSSEEEDSSFSSTIMSKLTSRGSTHDHPSKVTAGEKETLNNINGREVSIDENMDYSNVEKYETSHRLARLDTYDTLRSNYSRTMKMKKRQIIMRKIANIEACLDYLGYVGRQELKMLYSVLQI